MSTSASSLQTLFLMDCMSLVFQSYYAIRGLTNTEGMPTNAVYGFTRQIQKFIGTYQPTHLAAVFDSKGPTFRHALYNEYKANRTSPPDDFSIQMPYIFKVLEAMGIPSCSQQGFEADDLIGTLSERAAKVGMRTVIISADKDLFQLVNEHVSVLRSRKEDMEIYGPKEVKERLGIGPEQVVDYLALVGDSSDNIPGVPGIGPKTALTLLEQFGSVENLIKNIGQIPNEKRRKLLQEQIENLRLYYQLAKIDCRVPLEISLDELLCKPQLNSPELIELYRTLGFHSMIRALPREPVEIVIEFGDEVPAVKEAPQAAPPPVQPIERKTDYRCVCDTAVLNRLVQTIRRAGSVAFDTETTATNPMTCSLVGISLCVKPGTAYYIPVGHQMQLELLDTAPKQLPLDTVREALAPIMADESIRKMAHNAKYDMRVLDRHGMPVRGLEFDSMIASYLLNPENSHSLKNLSSDILNIPMTRIDELIGKGKSALTMAEVDVDRVVPYACADADITLQLADILSERLKSNGLVSLFRDIEMPLVEVLDAMEAEGVSIDQAALKNLAGELQHKISEVAKRIYEVAGCDFNISSPKQVSEVLFQRMGLKSKRKTATGDSTSVQVLEELARETDNPLPGLILEYRHLDKIKCTYVDALPQMVNPQTGRIHTSFNQHITSTGRLSSSSPNLQNIPVRTSLGRQIRAAFIPNGPDQVLLSADYSQIELRILAHVTGDEALKSFFLEGGDIHARTAAQMFRVPLEQVTDEMRGRAKTINFGILYGMSAHRLSREWRIPHAEAQKFISDYFGVFPKVRQWMDQLLVDARKRGYVSTITGRRRMVPDLNARSRDQKAYAERTAINMPIQGASADMIKIAMVALQREIQQSGWKARMVLQVHDELVFSVPESEVEGFKSVVRRLMEEALPLDVPVRVDMKAGKTWAEC